MNVHMTGHWVVYKVMQCLERLCKIMQDYARFKKGYARL